MISNKQLRNYEVSIWTLQDSFITVLKPTNLENKEMFQNGEIILKNDGENTISFTIPMYISQNGEFIENPLWYSKKNGYLIANLRKLKVIFNKFTDSEEVFEFLITNVTENHEGHSKICEVKGDGLAFNELGKQGYKISLSEEDLYNEVGDAASSNSLTSVSIKNNLNYWVDKVLAGTNWKYSIQMDWSSIDGVIDQEEEGAIPYSELTPTQRNTLNNSRESLGLRRHDTIYEDAYVSSWAIQNSEVIPQQVISATEKLRVINENESNRYNLIQKIAEIFEVYTKFKYYYDENYHIIDREIIFYNNFLNDKNVIDLTYSYDTENVIRELNADDIVTKMFVKTLDDSSSPNGLTSITDTEANNTREDYLLNFDYLYSIETISEEQYKAIQTFEKEILQLNQEIIPLDIQIIKLEEELVEAEIARDNALAMKEEADKNITYFTEQLRAIYNDTGYNEDSVIQINSSNPALITISQIDGAYVGKFGSQYSGVVPGSITVYTTRSGSTLSGSVNFVQKVENKSVVDITFANSSLSSTVINRGYCYATFSYKPALEYVNLKNNYISLSNDYYKIYSDNNTKIESNCGKQISGANVGLRDYIENRKAFRKSKYEEKQVLISDFENMMGPALREGYWQPEDEYTGYGIQYDETITPSTSSSSTTSGKIDFIWDSELFPDEEKNYYEYSINKTKVYYPCIKLNSLNANFFNALKNKTFLDNLSFVYKTSSSDTKPFILPQGVSCKFAFLQPNSGGTVIPVLMLTNFYSETLIINNTTADAVNTQITNYVSYITSLPITSLLSTITQNNSTTFSVPASAWLSRPNNYKIVYPRLRINSDYLKTNADELFLNFYQSTNVGYVFSKTLEEFEDYYISSKNEKKYITIKSERYLSNGFGTAKLKIDYCISNTALQVYLDAIKIMKENAYPKVSYTVNKILSESLLYDTYNRLNQLVHINDAELKFSGATGYISEVKLNLDKPWEDEITIQNYKNKFEDLFSTIVAQTEAMERNGYKIAAAMNAFNADGHLTGIISIDSLINSTETLSALIRNNANVIAAKAVSEAAKHKATLASTEVYRVMHGETGLAFTGNNIDKVLLNQDDGLLISGKSGSQSIFFKLDNANMGFFKGSPDNIAAATPQLYYDNGNLALSGTVYAANGWFGDENGWIIGTGLVDSNGSNIVNKIKNGTSNDTNSAVTGMTTGNLGGLLYSANGKAIFTAGTSSKPPMIVLTKNGFSNPTVTNDALFLFDGSNLFINGHITTAAGLIGGWAIDSNSIYYGTKGNSNNNNDVTLMSSSTFTRTINSTARSSLKFAIGANFGVANDGSMYSSKGNIGGWTIGSNYIGDASTLNGSVIGMRYTTTNTDKVFWAGAAYNGSPSFYVTKGGTLYASGATINGTVYATDGRIGGTYSNNAWTGGWVIKSGAIYSGTNSKTSTTAGLYLGTDAIRAYNSSTQYVQIESGKITAKNVDLSGALTATSLSTGGRTNTTATDGTYIDNNGAIYGGQNKFKVTKDGAVTASNITVSGGSLNINDKFKVTSDGALTATGADVTGAIKATSGSFGNATSKINIGSDTTNNISRIYSGSKSSKTSNNNGFYLGTDGLALGGITTVNNTTVSKFQVNTDGTLYATSANITGTIIATSLKIRANNTDTDIYNYIDGIASNYSFSVTGASFVSEYNTWKNGINNKTQLLQDSGKIALSAVTGTGNLSTLTVSGNNIILSSSNGTLGNSNLKLTPTSISITSGGAFDITSTNFIVNSAATGANTIFQVGNTSGSYIKYTANGGLVITGAITATSLTLSNTSLPASSVSGLAAVATSGSYNSLSGTPNLTVYIAKDGTIGSTPANGATGFTVSSTGLLQASNAIIWGEIYASGGNIGGCTFYNGHLVVPSAYIDGTITANAIVANASISGPSISGGTISGTTISGSTIYSGNANDPVFKVDETNGISAFKPASTLLGWQNLTDGNGNAFTWTSGQSANGPAQSGQLGNHIYIRGSIKITVGEVLNLNNTVGTMTAGRWPGNSAILHIGTWGTINTATAYGGYFQFAITTAGEIRVFWIREYDGSNFTRKNLEIWLDVSCDYWQ